MTRADIVALAIAGMIVFAGILIIPGCAHTPADPEPTTTITPPRYISPRCAEVEPEVEEMRHWCNMTMIPPSRQREACRMVETYESECL